MIFTQLKRWFIGEYLGKTADVFERSKIELLYHYSISFFFIGTAYYVSTIIRGFEYHTFVLSFAVVALLLIPFILKYKQSVKLASLWYVIQQILVSSGELMIQQNRPDITSGLWIMTFVLFAFFLYGRTWGIIIILVMQVIMGIAGAISMGLIIPEEQKYKASLIEFLVPFSLNIIIVWMFIKTRNNAETYIKQQSDLLEKKSKELEAKNNDVKDSIQYAKRIQMAILPSTENIKRTIPDSFIFYKPKDIVSGDFYWFHEIDENRYIFVCADCTGHGVPGAFMTVIGSNLLNLIVIDNKIYQPFKILSELDKHINFTLKQQEDRHISVQDGMDITIMIVNKGEKELILSSAKRPLVLIRNNEMKEFKGSKDSIGGMRMGEKNFEEIKLNYLEDDLIYFYTDGYHDQFGGSKGKKYSTKRLKNFLLSINTLPLSEQQTLLRKEIEEWMNTQEQVDDMLITGIKF